MPGALAWVSAHPRRCRCRGVVLGCLQRSGDREGTGHPSPQPASTVPTARQHRRIGVPIPLANVRVGACVAEGGAEPTCGVGTAYPTHSQEWLGRGRRVPWAPHPSHFALPTLASPPQASEATQDAGPCRRAGSGVCFPLGVGGKGEENKEEATASSFSLPLILLHSLLLPLPPSPLSSPLSPPSLFLIPATSSEPHSAAAASGV